MENNRQDKNLIYGRRAVEEFAKRHPNMIKMLWTSHEKEFLEQFPNPQFQVVNATNDKMENLFNFRVNHQGYVAEVKEYNYVPFKEMITKVNESENELVLLLDKIQDPYNFGAIIRSASLMNVKNIIILEKQQVPVNSTVVKTSAGTVYEMNISKVANLGNAIDELKKNGFWIYASNLNAEAKDIREEKFEGKVGLVIGNEEKGISPKVTSMCDVNIYLPSNGLIDSYNASVAAALMMYVISDKLKTI